ncbi:kinase-like domain-containing protein [Bipolaris maydis]|nr:kinase-like domain-containing protein [Bipolaris maydis]
MKTRHPIFSSLELLFIKFLETLRTPREARFEIKPLDTRGYLAAGGSGVVYGIDAKSVRKEFYEDEARSVECEVYERLGTHPRIAKLLEVREDGSLILERGTSLRKILEGRPAQEIPIQTKVKWLKDAAKGYLHLHSLKIIHADVGCHNWILTAEQRVKLIDFEGCSVDGKDSRSCYEWFSNSRITSGVSKQTDMFAFGCAVYELVTGKPPHYEQITCQDRSIRVDELYANGEYPDVTHLPLCNLIQNCWSGAMGSMAEIVRELEAFH